MTDPAQPDPPATTDDLPERGRVWLARIAIVAVAIVCAVLLSTIGFAIGGCEVNF